MNLFDATLEQLRERVAQLEEWARATEEQRGDLHELGAALFAHGVPSEDDWDDYHRVRSEYDRRAAEEFDLGQ
jgi:hypothetical protein